MGVLATVWSCGGPLGPDAEGEGRELTTLPMGARDLRLSGERLVFAVEDDQQRRIVELDLVTESLTTIVDDTMLIGGHDVSGDRVAWFDQFGLATSRGEDRMDFPGWNGAELSLDGDRAAFEGGDGTQRGIMLADLSSGSIERVSTRGGAPRLSGDRIAWIEVFKSEIFGTRSVIKLYDSGDTLAIANEREGLSAPFIGESAVAWTVRDTTGDVYGSDFEGESFAIATGPTEQRAVAVLDEFVAWVAERSPGEGRLAVHLFDLATGEVARVSDWGVVFVTADAESLLWRDDGELIHFTPR